MGDDVNDSASDAEENEPDAPRIIPFEEKFGQVEKSRFGRKKKRRDGADENDEVAEAPSEETEGEATETGTGTEESEEGEETEGEATEAEETETEETQTEETQTEAEEAPSTAPKFGYEPAWDGFRAWVVLAVLLFHARFSFAQGGFLGVSSFFTLSGFLITTLLLHERGVEGRISLRSFWRRRVRRLLPAAWMTMAFVLVLGATGVWNNDQLRSLRGDLPASLLQVVNWHFILEDRSYGADFAAPSPLEHYWSLAVEEQFYMLFPLVAAACFFLARGRRWLLGLVAAVATGASVFATVAFRSEAVDRVYFGTDTRLAELAIGVGAAVLLHGTLRSWPKLVNYAVAALGVVAAAGQVLLWNTATLNSEWLYPGGLLASAGLTLVVVLAALVPGPLRWLMMLPPLRALGRISYGVYLLHWPVFLWLNPVRLDLGQWELFGVQMVVTIALALLSYRLLERPIRLGTWPRGTLSYLLAPTTAILLAVAMLVTTSDLEPRSALVAAEETNTGQEIVVEPTPKKVLFVGDQLAGSLQSGVDELEAEGLIETQFATADDCGIAAGGFVRLGADALERDSDRCDGVLELQLAAEEAFRPDVVVVWSAVRALADRWLGPETEWGHVGDPAIDDFLRAEYRTAAKSLGEGGANVVWLTAPHIRNTAEPEPLLSTSATDGTLDEAEGEYDYLIRRGALEEMPTGPLGENDDQRVDRLNEIIAGLTDAGVEVVDAGGRMAGWPGGEFEPARRNNGVGVSPAVADDFVQWLYQTIEPLERSTVVSGFEAPETPSATVPPPPPPSPRLGVQPGGNVRLLVVGDSVGFNLGYGAREAAKQYSNITVTSAGQFGCSMARGGNYRYLNEISTTLERCDWSTLYPDFLESKPDVVVLLSGLWDIVDRILPGDSEWRTLGDPVYDAYLLSEIVAGMDLLASQGATVAIATYPHVLPGRDKGFVDIPEGEPERVDRLNEIFAEAVALRPGVSTMVDFQGWMKSLPGGELNPEFRSDGLHMEDEFAPQAGEWLLGEVVRIAETAG